MVKTLSLLQQSSSSYYNSPFHLIAIVFSNKVFTYSGICFYLTFAFISSMACNCCMILVLKASSYEQQKKLPMFQALCMVFLTH